MFPIPGLPVGFQPLNILRKMDCKADGLRPIALEDLGALLDHIVWVWARSNVHGSSVVKTRKCSTKADEGTD